MRFNLATRGGRGTLKRVIAAAAIVFSGSNTFADAEIDPQFANHGLIPKREVYNLELPASAIPGDDHDFVISLSLLDGNPCQSGQSTTPGQHILGPVTDNEGSSRDSPAPKPPSLDQIVSALHGSGQTVILLHAGVYRLSHPLMITEASGALVIRACPGETPVIEAPADGPAIVFKNSRRAALAGLVFTGSSTAHIVLDGAADCVVQRNTFLHGDTAISLDHARHNQIIGNVIHDVASTGIELKDGSDANVVAENVVDGANAPETFGGGIFLHGTKDNRIAHNVIERTNGFGIGVSNWDEATINVGTIIEFNLLRRTVLNSTDSGAIYVLGRSGVDTGIVIASNVIDGFGSPGNHNVGIYLDDSTSGATVIGNLIRGVGSDAVQIHGGQDNHIENNLLDLGAGTPSALLFQAAPADTKPLNRQTGNTVERNILLSSSASPRPFVWYDGGTPAIADNLYVLLNGAAVVNEPRAVDQQPHFGDDTLLPTASEPGYGPVQIAAERAIGFRPIDIRAAGLRNR